MLHLAVPAVRIRWCARFEMTLHAQLTCISSVMTIEKDHAATTTPARYDDVANLADPGSRNVFEMQEREIRVHARYAPEQANYPNAKRTSLVLLHQLLRPHRMRRR